MGLEFTCLECAKPVFVQFLKIGEIAQCKNCGASCEVPVRAQETDTPTIVSTPTSLMTLVQAESSQDSAGGFSDRVSSVSWTHRILGLNFIGGGVLGVFGFFDSMTSSQEMNFLSIVLYLMFAGFYIWCISLGVKLLEQHERSLKWARNTLFCLIPQFSGPIVAYMVSTGIYFKLLFQITPETGMHFLWGFAGFMDFGLNQQGRPLILGFDLFPIALTTILYYFDTSHEDKTEIESTQTSVDATVESDLL